MSDLRKRLNAAYENGMFNEDWDDLDGVCALLLEAESRLAQLESVLAEAGEALEPFAECGNAWMKHASDGWPVFGGEESKTLVVIGDLRRAATVSAKIDEMDAAQENGK